MYIKLFNQILDSSIASNRKLRHFFTDLMLCSDADGNVIMTKDAIANRIRTTREEVEWGLDELMKPDPESNTLEHEGRRVIALEGHGYGWKIVNYEHYRDIKSAAQMREETRLRVQRHREKTKKLPKSHDKPASPRYKAAEARAVEALAGGDETKFEEIAEEGLPKNL